MLKETKLNCSSISRVYRKLMTISEIPDRSIVKEIYTILEEHKQSFNEVDIEWFIVKVSSQIVIKMYQVIKVLLLNRRGTLAFHIQEEDNIN